MEIKIFRRFFGPKNEIGKWKIWNNWEMYHLFNGPHINLMIKVRDLDGLYFLFKRLVIY